MPPADAEWMSGRVGVYLVTLIGIEIDSRLKKPGPERQELLVRSPGILDVEVEVDLLRGTVGPLRRNMVGCELHPDPPPAFGVNDTVPAIVLEYAPTNDAGPERTFRMQVRRVEHDDLPHHPHSQDRTGASGRLRYRS